MKVFARGVLALLCLAALGCSNPAQEAAKARLQLARQKHDLDEMFLALKAIESTAGRSRELREELALVERGISLLEGIKLHQSDHNHEQVVQSAAALLELFPKHPHARRALKESGLIFAYLQEATGLVDQCFVEDHDAKRVFVRVTNKSGEIETDYSFVLHQLDKADAALKAAKDLDPQFEPALELEGAVADTRDTLGVLLAAGLYDLSAALAANYEMIFNTIYSDMTKSLDSSYRSPSDVWKSWESGLQRLEDNAKPLLEKLQQLSSHLGSCSSPESPDFVKLGPEAFIQTLQHRDAVTSPSGSMTDYRRDVAEKTSRLVETLQRMGASQPNEHELQDMFSGVARFLDGFELFKDPNETRPLLTKYNSLIST